MNVLFRTLKIFILIFAASSLASAVSDDAITFRGDLFGRTSANFTSKSNIQYVVPSGSTGTVIDSVTLPSGSKALRVKITNVNGSRGSDTIGEGQETWVYSSRHNPLVAGGGDSSSNNGDAKPPHARIWGVAEGEDPNLARSKDRRSTEGTFCPTCEAGKSPVTTKRNQDDIHSLADRPEVPPRARIVDENDSSRPSNAPRPAKPSETSAQSVGPVDPNNPWSRFPQVNRYSQSDRVRSLIQAGRNNAEPHPTSWCYRYVKRALYNSGMVSSGTLNGGYAKQAVNDLKSKGWTNLMDNAETNRIINGNPRNAPKGAVIVYAYTATSGAGHIEIKDSDGPNSKYLSDFVGQRNFLYSPRAQQVRAKVIGVMVKI